jgi:cell division protein FtsW
MSNYQTFIKKFFDNLYGDRIIWIVVMVLSVLSLLAVWSSTGSLAYKYQEGNTFYYMLKHAGLMIFGLFIMYLAHLVKYKYYSRVAQILLFLAVPLLVMTLLTGANLNEASRWLYIPGINLSFQTSDLAKLALIMYLARLLSKKQDDIKDLRKGFIPLIAPILITVVLIFPANFSTAAILFTTSIILLFIGRISLKYIFGLLGMGLVGVLMLVLVAQSYPKLLPRLGTWQSRIESFSDKDSEGNYQAEQSKIAIATGGLFGKLPGNSMQRNFLPHPYSDFIYSIIIEEYGFAGGFIVVLLYLVLLYRAVRIAIQSPGTFGAFLSIGLMFSLVFQAFINMGVAVNLLPVTGQPLPLLSMGGTSLWFTSFSIGIVLSVSKEINSTDENIIPDDHE